MGSSRWNPDDWMSYSSSTKTKKREEIFSSRNMDKDLNPLHIKIRESRDSDINPTSNAIIVALDVTGSMGVNADQLARKGLGIMVEEIIKRQPVSDPHIMCMGVGDAYYDTAPLQVTQFEADITIAKQLEKIWLEKGGGGNDFESYNLPWYFAALHTSIDCFEKRNKKGYLFTIGDEEAPKDLLASQIQKIFGKQEKNDYTSEQLLNMVSKMYNVYHIVVENGNHAKYHMDEVMSSWTELLGQKVLKLANNDHLAEVIVSAIEINEGRNAHDVVKSWSGDTSITVQHAVNQLTKKDGGSGTGVVRF